VRATPLEAGRLLPALLVNLGILLVPAILTGSNLRSGGHELGLFLLGASALCLADLAGQGHGAAADIAPGDRGVERLAWVQGLSVLAAFWTGLAENLGSGARSSAAMQAVGFLLMLGGALLRYSAIRSLGKDFVTEIRFGPELVRRGVYDRVRHPSETGLLLSVAGSGLLLCSPALLCVFAFVLLPVVVRRTTIEERALAMAFGAEHDRYVQEAGRFLPRRRRGWTFAARPAARTPRETA